VVLAGATEKLLPVALVPTLLPPVATVYHCMVEPVVEVAFKLVAEPAQIDGGLAETAVGTAGSGVTVTVTPAVGPGKIPVQGLAVPSILK